VSHSANNVNVLRHLADETDANGAVLATFTYDSMGVPVSVQVGSDPNSSPRYYYVYNGHGDVVALVDAQGNTAASYAYDAFGQLTSASESFGSGTTWTNPYRYDGQDGVRYDGETGLYWMSVRAYDPALGRFLSRDPLGRAPLFFADQPYVYAGNNPLINVDPSGQRFTADMGKVRAAQPATSAGGKKRVKEERGRPPQEKRGSSGEERAITPHGGEGQPNDATWISEDPSHRYTIWIGKIDKPDTGTPFTHINLHIRQYRSTKDLFNFHIWYFGFDAVNDVWYWQTNHEKEQQILSVALDFPDAWAVGLVINKMLDALVDRSGVHILYTITSHVNRSGIPDGESLKDGLSASLIALRDKWWRETGLR
jgi:RHS repeat-associated protein